MGLWTFWYPLKEYDDDDDDDDDDDEWWMTMTVAVPRRLSSLGDRSFATAGPRAWNRLPSHLRLMQSADTFRRHLKTFVFHQAFLSWHC